MCGIVGIRRFDGAPVREDRLRSMTERLEHRGPDDEGYWIEGGVGFGHRRLSIIDVAGSHQPMASPDGRVHVTFNGEILNYERLRAGMDVAFRTGGDTEVVAALHASRGIRGLEELRGQFAYGAFDGEDLWLVRDRLGILPLFYYLDDDMLAFASEVKALLPVLPRPPRVDEASLDSYLTRRAVAAPYTLFEGVRKVPPGHWMRVDADGGVTIERYWSIPTEDWQSLSDLDAVRLLDAGLREAIELALVADVPVGALLSGGVDSSLIVALATELRDGDPLSTFAAGFGDPRHDELAQAREVSRRFHTDHHEVVLDPEGFSKLWGDLSWYRDAPISEPADVAVFELAKLAHESVRVVLTGEGSDALFGGYPKYALAKWGRVLDVMPPAPRQQAMQRAAQALPLPAARLRIALRAMAGPDEAERLTSWFAPFMGAERDELLAGVSSRPPPDVVLSGDDPLTRMLAHDCDTWLADNLLERGDRMAMAASVEIRPPFLDHKLVELAFRLPPGVKVRRNQLKWVLKEVARQYLPDTVVDRRKVGFRVPIDIWFRGHLCDMANDMLLDGSSFVSTTMDRTAVRNLLDAHRRGRRDESIRIWTLLSLEMWHDAFFNGGSRREGAHHP